MRRSGQNGSNSNGGSLNSSFGVVSTDTEEDGSQSPPRYATYRTSLASSLNSSSHSQSQSQASGIALTEDLLSKSTEPKEQSRRRMPAPVPMSDSSESSDASDVLAQAEAALAGLSGSSSADSDDKKIAAAASQSLRGSYDRPGSTSSRSNRGRTNTQTSGESTVTTETSRQIAHNTSLDGSQSSGASDVVAMAEAALADWDDDGGDDDDEDEDAVEYMQVDRDGSVNSADFEGVSPSRRQAAATNVQRGESNNGQSTFNGVQLASAPYVDIEDHSDSSYYDPAQFMPASGLMESQMELETAENEWSSEHTLSEDELDDAHRKRNTAENEWHSEHTLSDEEMDEAQSERHIEQTTRTSAVPVSQANVMASGSKNLAAGVGAKETDGDFSEASAESYQEPRSTRDYDVAAGVAAKESDEDFSEAAESYQEPRSTRDYFVAAGVAVKEDAVSEAIEETNIETDTSTSDANQVRSIASTTEDGAQSPRYIRYRDSLAQRSPARSLTSSQSSGLAHATEPPSTKDTSQREDAQRSVPLRSAGDQVPVTASVLNEDGSFYDPSQLMPEYGLAASDDDSEETPSEEGLDEAQGCRNVAQGAQTSAVAAGSQAYVLTSDSKRQADGSGPDSSFSDTNQVRSPASTTEDVTQSPRYLRYRDSLAQQSSERSLASSQPSGLAHAKEPPLINDASQREGVDHSQRSAPSQNTGNQLLVASSALEVLNDVSVDNKSYDSANLSPSSEPEQANDEEYCGQTLSEEELMDDTQGDRCIAQHVRDNTAQPGSQATAMPSSETEYGRSAPDLIVMSNSSESTDSSEVAAQAEAALAGLSGSSSADLDEKQNANICSQSPVGTDPNSSSSRAEQTRLHTVATEEPSSSSESPEQIAIGTTFDDSDSSIAAQAETALAELSGSSSADSYEKQNANICSQGPVGTDPDSSSSRAEQARLQTATTEEPTAANKNSGQIAIGTTFDDSDSSEGSDLVALAQAALAQWDASSSDSDSSSSETYPPASRASLPNCELKDGDDGEASEASAESYQEPASRSNYGVAGVMAKVSVEDPSEASVASYQEMAPSDYHGAAGVTVKDGAGHEAIEETNVKTVDQLQALDEADDSGESDSGPYDPYQSTPQVAAVGATANDSAQLEDSPDSSRRCEGKVATAALAAGAVDLTAAAIADDSGQIDLSSATAAVGVTANDSAQPEDSPDLIAHREGKVATTTLAAGTVGLTAAAIADDSGRIDPSSATAADRYGSSSTSTARSAGDDSELVVSSFDDDFNDYSDGSSYDLTKFMPDSEQGENSEQKLSEDELVESESERESSEQKLSEDDLVESEKNSRAAQVSAAQIGLQAAVMARQNRAELNPIDYNSQASRVGYVDFTSQAQAASLANEMTANSKLFRAQKEREEARANPTAVEGAEPDIEEGIPISKEKDRPKPKPKTKAVPVHSTRKKCASLIIALLLVVGAIVAAVGTTQGWFESSSSKSVGEDPTVFPTVAVPTSPTMGPTTTDLVSGPTTGPTTLGPSSIPATVGPTTMDLVSQPTAGPSALRPTSGPTSRPTLRPTPRPSVGPTLGATSGPTQGLALVPSSGPTTSPTVFVVPQDLLDLVSAVSFDGGASAQLEGTPQNQGVKWLGSSAVYDTLTDQQKIQRYCLAVLYYSTDGDRWTNNDGWLSDETECTWFTRALREEACDSNGLFIALLLGFNRLGGELPPEIGLLTALRAISIGGGFGGSINGTLPSYLGLLTQMQFFNVRDNDFSGTIPPELGAWIELDVLNLSRNRFSGPIPTTVGQMTALTRLDLSSNRLTGGVPTELVALNLLEDVRLENNDLTGAVPNSVCTLFFSTAPLFFTDCGNPPGVGSEIGCFCCTHCCSDELGCVSVIGS